MTDGLSNDPESSSPIEQTQQLSGEELLTGVHSKTALMERTWPSKCHLEGQVLNCLVS